jgi:hypothetical protein
MAKETASRVGAVKPKNRNMAVPAASVITGSDARERSSSATRRGLSSA